MPPSVRDLSMGDVESKPFTGKVLVSAYADTLRELRDGRPDPDAVRWFNDKLNTVAMRGDDYGVAARRTRANFAQFYDALDKDPRSDPSDFLDGDAVRLLDGYLVDGGDYESTRRFDLLGVDRQPSYVGNDGGVYVDAAGTPQRIPVEKYLGMKDQLIPAFQGKAPMLGRLTGAMSASMKAANMAVRATEMAVTGKSWEETTPGIDVPTADPAFPFALLPRIADTDSESYRLLQNPVEVRAIQEALAKFKADGDLDLTGWDHFLGAAGFLADFAAVGKVTGGAGRVAGAGVRTLSGGRLLAETAAAAGETGALQTAGAMARPAIPHSFGTIRDFAIYNLVNDSLSGKVTSVNDAAVSGLAGAKEGAIMLGAGFLTRVARTGVMAGLASKTINESTKALEYRFGALGRAVGNIYEKARDREGVDALVKRLAALAGEGKSLREMAVRVGWEPAAAQMLEHTIDSAAMGATFGAYNNAIQDPEYESLGPFEKTARVVRGLTSPEAIGGAAAFAGSVVAQAYANKVKLGKEWQNAPPALRAELDQRVQTIISGLSQPENHEPIEAFRKAFDAYRERSPGDFLGWSFSRPWEREIEQAVLDGNASRYRSPMEGIEIPQGEAGDVPMGIGSPGVHPPEAPPEAPPPEGPPKEPQGGPQGAPGSTLAPSGSEVAPAAPERSPVTVAAMPTVQGLFGEVERAGTTPKPTGTHVFQPALLDIQPGDLPGQTSMLDIPEAMPSRSTEILRANTVKAVQDIEREIGGERAIPDFDFLKDLLVRFDGRDPKKVEALRDDQIVEESYKLKKRLASDLESWASVESEPTAEAAPPKASEPEPPKPNVIERAAKKSGGAAKTVADRIANVKAKALEGELGFQSYIRAIGGLSLRHEIKHRGLSMEVEAYTRKQNGRAPFGLGPIAHGAKSEKGFSVEGALERAQQDGMLPRGSNHRDFFEALESNAPGHRGGRDEAKRMEAEHLALMDEQARSEGYASYAEAMEIARQATREMGEETDLKSEEGDFTLFQLGENAPGFLDFPDRPTAKMSPESSRAWLSTVQNTLFPITEFRNERMSGLVRSLVGTFGIKVDEAEAIAALAEAHAATWSKSHGKKIEDWYHERLAGITRNAPPLGAAPGTKAATTFLADGRAVLHALDRPTLDSVLEEFGHIWRHDLQGKPKETLESWAGVKDGVWTVRADEKFAAGVRRWVRSGKAPSEGLKSVFKQLGEWMRNLFPRLAGTGLDVRMSSDVRKAMGSLFNLPSVDSDVVARERAARLTPEVRADIYTKNRNRPQYIGLDMDSVVVHELRGGLPDIERTTAIKVAQAGDSMRQAADILKAHNALALNAPVDRGDYQRAILDLAAGGQRFTAHFTARGSLDALTLAVESAKRAQVQMREVSRDVMPDDRRRSQVDSLFKYLDESLGSEVSSETIAEMEKAGLLDPKTGRANRLAISMLDANITSGVAIQRASGAAEHGNRLDELTYGARPWLALGRVNNAFREHALARSVKLKRLVDLGYKAKLPPSIFKQLQRVGLVFGGMWQANALSSIGAQTVKSAAMYVFQPWESMVKTLQGRGDEALGRIMARFGWRVPPASHMRILNDAIESGSLTRMKGPEDFEARMKGTGYLFDIARDINDVLMQLGQNSVLANYLAPGQYEKFGGKWRPHLALKLEADSYVKEVRAGRIPLSWGSRQLSRRDSPEEKGRLQIDDPFSWLPTALHQEGKLIQYLGTVADMLHGGYAVSAEDWAKLDPYTQGEYVRFALNPESNPAGLGNGPALRNWTILGDMLAKQLDPTDPRPKSKVLQRTISRLLGVDAATGRPLESGSMYLPRQLLWELEGLSSQTWNPPEVEQIHQRAMLAYEQATKAFRRGLTIGRPKHWTLNIGNSIGTNHTLDRLPMWDVARSVFTGQGYFADGVRDVLSVLELAKLGNPSEKPKEWSIDKWDRVQLFHDAFKTLNGTTFTGVGFESSVVTDVFSAIVTPDMQTAGLLRDMEAKGFSPEHASMWRVAILDYSRRLTGGMAEFDRKLLKMMGSHDASERARAVQNFSSMYQLWEMLFKWSATLRTIDTQPEGISIEQAVRWSALGTADYGNTSPIMRAFNTSYGTFTNPLYQKTDGFVGGAGRALAREMLKGRFWMYSSTMGPALLASVATHPARAAGILGLTAGMSAVLHQLSTKDPEEEAAWQEDLRGSIAMTGQPALDEETLKILARDKTRFPNVSGGPGAAGVDPDMLSRVWLKMLGGAKLVFQAPNRGDETRVSSLEDLSPGYGNWLGLVTGSKNFAAAGNDQRARSVFDMMSLRSMELSMLLAQGGVGMAKALNSEGPDAFLDSMKGLRQTFSDAIPTASPMFLLSRDGQRFLEVAHLNGQNFDEYARGIVQVDQPSAASNLGEFMFSALWRSQRLLQPHMGGVSEREALDGILGRMFPGADRPSSGLHWDKLRAVQGEVHYQMSEVLSGTYEEWLKWGRAGGVSFDAMLVPSMFGVEGEMEKFLGSERDPELQSMKRDYLNRFVTSDEWQRALGQMMDVARKRQMRPEFFRAAITSSMRDPTGQALLNWVERKLFEGHPKGDDLADLASAFLGGVKSPNPGTQKWDQWAKVLQRFYEYGLPSTFIPDEAADALRRLGKKPELTGGPALQSALNER